jgi:hypothetical protein
MQKIIPQDKISEADWNENTAATAKPIAKAVYRDFFTKEVHSLSLKLSTENKISVTIPRGKRVILMHNPINSFIV